MRKNKRMLRALMLTAAFGINIAGFISQARPAYGAQVQEASSDGKSWYDQVEITAHRGDMSRAPENTLLAFEEAIASGADWIELDVNQTKDGVLVIFHDENLERVAGIKANIWEVSSQELQSVCIASHMGPAYRDVKVPSLEETLEACRGRIKLNIEIKSSKHQSSDFVEQVVSQIQQKGMEEQCMITSFSYPVLQRVKAAAPSLETGLISSEAIGQPEMYTAADNFMMSIEQVGAGTVQKIHSLGKDVAAWTVNDRYSVQKCREAQVDNLITDYPDSLLTEEEAGDTAP